eukprot:m51a1_g11213 putative C-tail anchored protein (156) ;mRNA; r:9133-11423
MIPFVIVRQSICEVILGGPALRTFGAQVDLVSGRVSTQAGWQAINVSKQRQHHERAEVVYIDSASAGLVILARTMALLSAHVEGATGQAVVIEDTPARQDTFILATLSRLCLVYDRVVSEVMVPRHALATALAATVVGAAVLVPVGCVPMVVLIP